MSSYETISEQRFENYKGMSRPTDIHQSFIGSLAMGYGVENTLKKELVHGVWCIADYVLIMLFSCLFILLSLYSAAMYVLSYFSCYS